ncbi:MAG: ACP phosphodiesterase [Anaerolineae bacterium]|nr:ACP phosphodiesterase [Thermoflexales bacterium]MDW8395059.1 ACP phosphodiesterase [Anaerolineae bacterium]
MNWLAHLFLSEPDPAYRIGNIIADWVKGEARAALPRNLQRGIACHQVIDRFTDAHPIVKQSQARIRPPFRRFAAVLVDVFYDHFLAAEWQHYCATSLLEWTHSVYVQFAQFDGNLPADLRAGLMRMAQEDWLGSYASVSGVSLILARMARRLSRPTPLAQGVTELIAHYNDLRDDFRCFFPELQRHVEAWQAATHPLT